MAFEKDCKFVLVRPQPSLFLRPDLKKLAHNRLLELQCLAPVECEVVIYDCSKYVSVKTTYPFALQTRIHCILFSSFFFFLSLLFPFLFTSLCSFLCFLSYILCFSPITEAYHSAYQFVNQAGFTEHVVTRAEYAEYGSNASRKKFRDWKPQESEKEKPKEASSKVKGKQREDDRTQVSTTRMTKTRNKLGAGTPTTNNSSTRKISLRSSHPPSK